MDGYTIAWLAWLGSFLVLEARALIDKDKGDTFSEHVWKWFAVKDRVSKTGQFRRAVLIMFLAWLVAHFVTGGAI